MKNNLIKHEQSLRNDYNEHLSSKWSSRHTMQLRVMLNQLHVQQAWCIKETKAKSNKYQSG